MPRVLVINGHEYYPHSEGRLNTTLFNKIVELLSPHYAVDTSILQQGYTKPEEQRKVLAADYIVYQTPIYNYSVPALFKKYLDETHEQGVYFTRNRRAYGLDCGLLAGKQYMFSTTWNAPRSAFQDENQFFEGRDVDDVLFPLYLTQKYTGMRRLPTFSCFDIKKRPRVQVHMSALRRHLEHHFEVNAL